MACNKPFLKRELGVVLPCGHCAGCRKDKLTMWTDRIQFEMLTNFRKNVGTFLTLTYDDDHCPSDGVRLDHVHKFIKDFRYGFDTKYGRDMMWNRHGDWKSCSKFKYVLTSEYGDIGNRPHYHAIIVGADPWIDDDLYKLWSYGFYLAKPANGSTIRYVLKYISTEDTRVIIRSEDGMVLNKNFHLYSQGIGKQYIFQHANEFRANNGYSKGKWLRPLPPYYKSLLGITERTRHYDTDMIRQYNEWRISHPEDCMGSPDVRFMRFKQYQGKPRELSADIKEASGIKYFGGLKSCN